MTLKLEMTPEQYRRHLADYELLLSYAVSVAGSLTGLDLRHEHETYADIIFGKLICHGLTLKKLSPPSVYTTPDIWDLASACAVARALIESYDALAYIAVHQVDAAERVFRVLLWKLHSRHRQLSMLDKMGSIDPQVGDVKRDQAFLIGKLMAHPMYMAMPKEQRKKIEGGDCPATHKSQRELNAVSGVDHDFYLSATMFLSQYVHTYPFALHQLKSLRPGTPECLQMASMPLWFSMAFIAKAVDGMRTVWPGRAAEPSKEVAEILGFWMHAAENGAAKAPA